MKLWVKLSLVALVIALVFAVWTLWGGVQLALEWERTLQAYHVVLRAVAEHVEEHGAWPSSWDDLARISNPEKASGGGWTPDDIEQFKSRVHVRFDVSDRELRNLTADRFDLIEQIDSPHLIREEEIEMFLEDIRRHLDDTRGQEVGQGLP